MMGIAAGGLGNQSHFKPKDKSQEGEGKERKADQTTCSR